jgi:hypothetical protein
MEKVSSSEPICKNGFTSFLNFPGINSNACMGSCPGHAHVQHEACLSPVSFYYIGLRNCSLHVGKKNCTNSG